MDKESLKLEKLKAEIDYYKDLFGKLFTLWLLVGGATLANIHRGGLGFWEILGVIATFYLFVVLTFIGYIYKRKINKLEEL